MKKHILLIIEPGDAIRNLIAESSLEERMEIVQAQSMEQAQNNLSCSPEIIIIDLDHYPEEACQFIDSYREAGTALVLVYLCRFDEKLVLSGLDSGADNYILGSHPCRISSARIRAALRREQGMLTRREEHIVRFGPFSLNLNTECLFKNGEKVHISERGINILLYLGKHAGTPVTPEEIYTHALKKEHGDITIIGVYIQRLRKMLEPNPEIPDFIKTIHGFGYMLNAAPSRKLDTQINHAYLNYKKEYS
ncbi:response regulator transcription factor [Brucepastera parasyntrophica]|uniref:response regulator transcription factor n=1 Tax=Brucepastera parasyntrophica TaxID=2880008 RepID=UPI002108F288|nr:response regulator transcription factor [Brucepastera parasyntrophica]ULQ58723.1 response regulator transcription factor [Brucepastera parasyntrophica]